MALKATVCKAMLQIADVDRGLYADHALTIARHPSENDERMMVRLLAYALSVPADDRDGGLELGKGMWEPEEPELWQRDLTGRIVHWVEVGQPDERRVSKACGRADRVSVFAYGTAWQAWWKSLGSRLAARPNLEAWRIPSEESRGLAELAGRSMQLQVNRQDGVVWVGDGERTQEITPARLGAAEMAAP